VIGIGRDTSYKSIMKEIDFLPEWYKSGRRRQVSYRTQYIAIGGIFVVMMVWSFTTTSSISKARAQVAQMAASQAQAEKVSAELAGIENKIRVLRQNEESIEQIDSRIDVASVLAEISYLIDERIVLQKVELSGEKFAGEQAVKNSSSTGTVVRVVKAKSKNTQGLPFGNVRFKVVLAGVAADASDVAVLMCKLEDSPYFCQVVLSFSRGDAKVRIDSTSSLNRETTAGRGKEESKNLAKETAGRSEIQVNEFEINCYLANYRHL
jgi:Tfp pilus assembly protein PilN